MLLRRDLDGWVARIVPLLQLHLLNLSALTGNYAKRIRPKVDFPRQINYT